MDLIYSILAVVAVISATFVAFSRKAVYCALWLVVTMLCLAGIFLVIQSPFVAMIQILVYAGAIMVLFLYVIMLLNPRQTEPLAEIVIARRGTAILLVLFFLALTVGFMWRAYSVLPKGFQFKAIAVKDIAKALLTDYLLPFELTSVLLLVAIVGAVLIAKRN